MDYKDEIDRYNKEYDEILLKPSAQITIEDRYTIAESIIRQTFNEEGNDISGIYKKVVLLNSLYSTNIFGTFNVAIKIHKITNFQKRVNDGDLTLIDEIRYNDIGGKTKDFYSFATKYCHHHNSKCYPIFDVIVADMISSNLKINDIKVLKNKLRQYPYFKRMIDKLAEVWELPDDYQYAKLDKFLWNKGKEGKMENPTHIEPFKPKETDPL